MRLLKVLLSIQLFLLVAALALPAMAADTSGTTVNFQPLVPIINDLIEIAAGILSAAVPALVGYLVMWLRNHGIAAKQTAQKAIVDRLDSLVANGLKFAETGADAYVNHLQIEVSNDKVAAAANYVIAQAPELLKQAGVDVSTPEGQQAVVRRVTAATVGAV